MVTKAERSLAVYLRNQARDLLTPRERADSDMFFAKLSDDQELYRYLEICGVYMTQVCGAWEYKLRNSRTDLPYEVWTNKIDIDKYGGIRIGDGPDAKVTLKQAVDVLADQARISASPKKFLTIKSGGKSGMPNTGKVPKIGSRRDNRGHN